ncbi:MAG: ATP-binding protein [Mycobacteriales bacterium]
MRRRILISILGVALVAILVLGLPLLVVSARLIGSAARDDLLREAQSVQRYVDRHPSFGPADRGAVARLVADGRLVTVSLPKEAAVSAGEPPHGSALIQRTQLQRGGIVKVAEPKATIRDEQLRAGLIIATLALLSALAATLVARLTARRLSGPLLQVADRAAALGAGDFRTSSGRYDVPELDRICDVLDHSAEEIAALVNRERDLASDVSHQLRTRLTSLQIRLEEIALSSDPAVRTEAAAAIEQTERLAGVIDELLSQARNARAAGAGRLDVGQEVAAIVSENRPAVAGAGRRINVCVDGGLVAIATPGRLHQAIGTLVENALEHGGGAIRIAARASGRNVVFEVTDEGLGVAPDLVPTLFERGVSSSGSTGVGLALARALVEADGGRLELRQPCPPVFAVFLPRAEPRNAG